MYSTSLFRLTAFTVIDVVRATDVDEMVFQTVCDVAELKTPFSVILKSASSSSRSFADLSTPVMS